MDQSADNDVPLIVRRSRAHVPYGPKHLSADEADADYLRAAVRNIEFSRCMGSNLTATVAAILNDLADQIDPRAIPPAVTGGGAS